MSFLNSILKGLGSPPLCKSFVLCLTVEMRGELQQRQFSVQKKKASEGINSYKEKKMEKTRAETDCKTFSHKIVIKEFFPILDPQVSHSLSLMLPRAMKEGERG